MVCDMWMGVNMSSKAASLRLAPRRFASWRSDPDRSHFWEKKSKILKANIIRIRKFKK